MATTSLSAFTQCCGYLIASVGPLGFGVLFDVSGGWTVPLLALCGVVVVQAVAGCLAVRPRYVEDELRLPRRVSWGVQAVGSGRWVRSVGSGRWGQGRWGQVGGFRSVGSGRLDQVADSGRRIKNPGSGAVSRAVASAARPSPRPVSPSPSVVVPATETGARRPRTAQPPPRRGAAPAAGELAMTCTDALTTVNPAARSRCSTSVSSVAPDAAAHRGSDVRRPRRDRRARRRRAGHRRARGRRRRRRSDPSSRRPRGTAARRPSTSGRPRSGARRSRCRSAAPTGHRHRCGFCGHQPLRFLQVGRCGDLEGRAVAGYTGHGDAERLDQPGVVGDGRLDAARTAPAPGSAGAPVSAAAPGSAAAPVAAAQGSAAAPGSAGPDCRLVRAPQHRRLEALRGLHDPECVGRSDRRVIRPPRRLGSCRRPAGPAPPRMHRCEQPR